MTKKQHEKDLEQDALEKNIATAKIAIVTKMNTNATAKMAVSVMIVTAMKKVSKEQEYLEALQRSQAEFDNYRKRNEFYAIKAKEEGIMLSVQKLLPVLDSFKAAEMQLSDQEFRGLSLVKELLITALKELGVSQIKALDEKFDPEFHNAIMVEENKTKQSQVVLEVLQEGYMLNDRVIRHSVVKINS